MTETESAGFQFCDHLRAEIPLLRRCGRALTGTQHLADLCVVQLMDDLVSGAAPTPEPASPRVSLYRRYLQVLQSFTADDTTQPFSVAFTPRSRQAHWLKAGEGFSNAAAAEILGVSEAEIESLLEAANAEMNADKKSNLLIIEDEFFIATDIALIAQAMGHAVVGIARTHQEGVAAFREHQIDLVLSDVQLADGSSGIEAVDEILCIADVPAIFITAYPERLLTGQRAEPAFLISKPFKAEALRATISQALFLRLPPLNSPSLDGRLGIEPRRKLDSGVC